jgi:DNA-binding NtrC family response regulator
MVTPVAAVRARVLVIDDDPALARAIHRALTREHDVVCVTSARDALAALGRDSYDAIVCDLLMAEINGMDLHAELERRAPELAQRMVFLTGGAFHPAAKEFLERGERLVLMKPFDGDQLRAAVRLIVG